LASDAAGNGRRVAGINTTYELANAAIAAGTTLAAAAGARLTGETIDVAMAQAEGRLLTPIDHPDPAHLHMSGTGLTHLGSAESRGFRTQEGDVFEISADPFELPVRNPLSRAAATGPVRVRAL
jgi:hypothetical protein